MSQEKDTGSEDFEDKNFVAPEADPVIISRVEHEKLLKEIQDYKDKYMRLVAEFDNARKRMEREKADFVKYANEGLVVDFLNILDDLNRSMDAVKAKEGMDPVLIKGLDLVVKRINDMLAQNGVKPIEAKGKVFDHEHHEVLMQEESEHHDDNVVLDEFQKGYKLHDRVVRTAKVKLAKKKNGA